MTGVSWLFVRSREHIECGVVVGRNLIGKSIGWLDRRHAQLVYEDAERVFNKRSKSLLMDASKPRKLWSTFKMANFPT